MNQVTHILFKDLRRLRWLLLVWGLILALQVLLSGIGAATAGMTFPAVVVLRELAVVLPALQTLMLALLVARLVHEEPLVGWNAFWLTRPYSSRSLFAAKLLFIVGVTVLTPLVADLATMAVFKAGPRAQLVAAPSFASTHLIWALALAVIAVVTPSLAAFVLTVIGGVVALVVVGLVLFTISFALGLEETTSYDGPIVAADPTPGFLAMIVFIAAALGVLAYQYRHRRRAIAAALAVAGLAATGIVPTFWPWPFLQGAVPDPGPWARNVTATQPKVDRRVALNIPRDPFSTEQAPRRRIHALVELTGLPPDVATQGVRVAGRLTLPDGTILSSRQTEGFSRRAGTTEGVALTRSQPPAQAALGVEILNEVERPGEYWPALLSLSDEEYARHRGKAARFDGTLDFHVYRTSVRATLPIRDGAAVDDGLSRIEVVRAQAIDGGYRLIVRRWRVLPITAGIDSPGYEYFLRNRREGQAVRIREETSWSGSFAGTSHGARALSAALGGGSFYSAPSGFVVQTEALLFPWHIEGGFDGAEPKLDPAWFQDAELVVVETAYAGFVTRSVTIADFRIPEQ